MDLGDAWPRSVADPEDEDGLVTDDRPVDDVSGEREEPLAVEEPRVTGGRSGLRFRAELRQLKGKRYSGMRVSREQLGFSKLDDEEEEDSEGEVPDSSDEEMVDDEGTSDVQKTEYGVDEIVSSASEPDQSFPAQKLDGHEEDTFFEQEQATVQRLRDLKKADMELAIAVAHQKENNDHLLNIRIRMQKLLTTANSLARGDRFLDFQQAKSEKVEETVRNTLLACKGILDQQNLCLDPEYPDLDESSVGVDLDSMWSRLCDHEKQEVGWRKRVLSEWDAKSAEASGKAASNAKKFKAINQSILAQIETILEDQERLLKRTQMKRAPVTVIGEDDSSHDVTHDPEIFDDGDLYQQLLRDIIASAGHTGGDLTKGQRASILRNERQRIRKNVDRKASKNRKLRYTVHDKLVGFLAPTPMPDPPGLEELVAGLFGKKKKLNRAAPTDND